MQKGNNSKEEKKKPEINEKAKIKK